MRNRNASSCTYLFRAVAALAILSALFFAQIAFAGPKEECSSAYDQTQALRRDHRLQSAHQAAVVCSRDVCTDFIRSDCTKWMAEIDASQPTVVFEVHDTAGRDISQVRIALDGRPWLDHLDGTAKPIDPGQHTLQYAIAGAQPTNDTILIREGEKNRKVTASFDNGVLRINPGASDSSTGASANVGPWILVGIGGASLITGAVTGGLVIHDKSVTNAHCFDATKTCDSTGEPAAAQGRVLGPVTTVTLAVGGVAVAAGVIWYAATPHRKSSNAASLIVVPIATPSSGGAMIAGSF